MTNEVTEIKRFFTSINVLLSDIWLESCIAWCKEENLPPNYTTSDLQKEVYEQWLLLDLRDVDVPSLPPNLSSQKHYILKGTYCLQMMYVTDISKPKLWQLQRIRNANSLTRGIQDDANEAGTGKRMLKLVLTDGKQEVSAIEYRPVHSLHINMSPGIKIRIIGPVTVRRGTLMLENQNVKLLGGEVEELLVCNAAENILAKELNMMLNPNPFTIQENILCAEIENSITTQHRNYKTMLKNTDMVNTKPNPPPTQKIANSQNNDVMFDDEVDDEMFLEAERQILSSNIEPMPCPNRSPQLFETNDFNCDDFNLSKPIISSTQAINTHSKEKTADSANLMDEDDNFFEEIDLDGHLNKIENSMKNKTEEILSIEKLLEYQRCNKTGVYKIKAKYVSVVEKLTLDDEYKIIIKIADSKNDVAVKLHSDIVADYSGLCPAAAMSLKQDILQQNVAAKSTLINGLKKLRQKLLTINSTMDIEIRYKEIPVIVHIYN